MPLLELQSVSKHFARGTARVTAVADVSLAIESGEALVLVGESGSGKSTLVRLVLGLLRPDAGRVLFEGRDLARLSGRELRDCRRHMQPIFRDPSSSLDPRFRADAIVTEPLSIHQRLSHRQRDERARELLRQVGLDETGAARYPHEFTSSERQRLAIARALAPRPRLVVADEPCAALDVLAAAPILQLLRELHRDLGLTFLLTSQRLGWVERFASRLAILLAGQVVECGPAAEVLGRPRHPYTRQLLAATPQLPAPAPAWLAR